MTQGVRVPRLVRGRMILTADQVDFEVRGFRIGDPAKRASLEAVGTALLAGYNATVRDDVADPVEALDQVEPELRGFAYEGAGMACAILDVLTLSRGRRLAALLAGSGDAYVHLILVGVGLALAQLRLPGWGGLRGLDPVYRWLAVDGRGFWQGFFQPQRQLAAGRAGRRSMEWPHRFRIRGSGAACGSSSVPTSL